MPRCSVVNNDRKAVGRRELSDDDEDESAETVSGQANPARHRGVIAARGLRVAFGMRVPIADIVKAAREQGVYFDLLALSVGLKVSASAHVLRLRAGRFADDYARSINSGEELTASLAMPEAKLAMPVEMIEDTGLEVNHLARSADGIRHHHRALVPQAGQTRLCRHMPSTIVAEGRLRVAAHHSSVQEPPARTIAASRPLTIR